VYDLLPCIIDLCDEIKVTPEHNNVTVLTSGNINGSSISFSKPKGGHTAPINTDGAKLKCRKAQKKWKK